MRYTLSLLILCCFCSFSMQKSVSTASCKNTADRMESIDSLLHSARIVVLDFWFIGCAPCKRSIPDMNQLAQVYSSKGVKIYGLNPSDDAAQINAFREKNGVTYNMLPVSFELARKCFVYEYPTAIVYKDNKIVMTLEGYSTLTKQQISDVLDKLLK